MRDDVGKEEARRIVLSGAVCMYVCVLFAEKGETSMLSALYGMFQLLVGKRDSSDLSP